MSKSKSTEWTKEQKAAAAAAKDKPAAPKEPKEKGKMSITKEQRAKYQKAEAKTDKGARIVDSGDQVAVELRNYPGLKALKSIARENESLGVLEKFNKYESANLNPGQIRMNIGNALRQAVKRGETVVIGGKKFFDREAQARAKEAAAKKAAKKSNNAK